MLDRDFVLQEKIVDMLNLNFESHRLFFSTSCTIFFLSQQTRGEFGTPVTVLLQQILW
jgi:hypothetical protein